MRRSMLAAVLLAGCSVPAERHLVDAFGDPLACVNEPPPTTADASVTISGATMTPFTGTALPDVELDGYFAGIPGVEFSTTSDGSGQFSIDQATGGTPRSFYLTASANGYVVTTMYPPAKLIHSLQADPQLVSSDELQHVAELAGMSLDPTLDQILLQVVDCNGNPFGGATVSSDPPGTIVYFAQQQPNPAATMTDGDTAVVFIGNVPASNTKIYATAGDTTFSTIDVDPAPGGLIQAAVQP
jgi:hypothetical protein